MESLSLNLPHHPRPVSANRARNGIVDNAARGGSYTVERMRLCDILPHEKEAS
jgi:hypothetical protein